MNLLKGKIMSKKCNITIFFEPYPLRRINAWKKTANIDLHSSGGHRIEFAGQKLFPISLILSHYIVLSKSHAIEKYGSRVYSKAALEKGWSLERAAFAPNWLNFPTKARLKRLNGGNWDKSEPWIQHEFLQKTGLINHQQNYLQMMTDERKQPRQNSSDCGVKLSPKVASMPNKQKKYNLSICAIFKNEAPYLAEWIEFHKVVGVEKFYLYNNNSTDNYLDVLRPYMNGDEIILIDWPQHPAQLEAYEHCLKTYGDESKWIAFIDIDEYLFSPIKSDLKEVLEEFQDYPGVVVNWLIFGDSGHDQKPNGLTIENFTMRAKDDYERHRRVKSIVQPDLAKQPVTSFHKFSYFNQSYPHGVTENKEPAPSDNEALHSSHYPSFQKLRINHYITRSKQERYQKWLRGMPDKEGFRKWEILEDCANRNDLQDLAIQKYLPLVKKHLKNCVIQENLSIIQPAQNLSKAQKLESYAPMPIVVGFPRSGTTLLRLMLDAHPDLAIPPETHFIPDILNLESDTSKPSKLREAFYQKLTAHPRWQDFHLTPEEFYENLADIEPFTISSGLRCFYQMYANRFGKSRWGDKTPLYVVRIKDIQTALPEAHFIHIIRDGRDTALSMKRMWWGAGDDMEKQASNWIWQIREGRQQAQFCQHYLEVRYEELITNTTKVLQDICAFINLPYHSQMEDYYKSAESRLNEFNAIYRSDGTLLRTKEEYLSIHSLTSRPPDQSRIGRWKREMSNEDRAKYEAIAGAMLRDLGYETGDIQKQLTLSNPFLSEYGPDIIGSTGGSGTRVVARIVRRGGMFIGTRLSKAEDAVDFVPYFTRWIDTFMAHRSSSLPLAIEMEMLQELQTIFERHLENLDLSKKSQPWGWKEPRSIFLLPFFHKHFPNMKFLHILRDGRDMAYSANQNQLHKHGSTLVEPAEQQWSEPLQSMALWSRLHLLTAEYGEKNMAGQYLRIRYEDLCFYPDATIERIFDFFGLSGDIKKIAQEEVSPPATIGRWRSQDTQTVATLHQIGKAALQKFGYLASEELNQSNLEPGVICNLAPEKPGPYLLEEIKADLERSRSRLSQIKAQLKQT
jgi:hypothetical protein